MIERQFLPDKNPMEDTHILNRLPDPRDEKITFKRPRRWRKRIMYCLLVLMIVLGVLGYKVLWTSQSDLTITDKSLAVIRKLKYLLTSEEKRIIGEEKGRINILLLGMGGAGHEGPYLTDTIMVASHDLDRKNLLLFSIPRDLAVYIPNEGFRKINSVNATGETQQAGYGGELSRILVSELLGWEIPYYVRVDFSAFEQFIDDMGGLKLQVPKAFTDYQFPTDDYKYQVVSFDAGEQTFSGKQALQYARSRHGCCDEGGDFARAKRQQILLQALKEQILAEKRYSDPKTLIQLYQNYQEHVDSNLTVGQLLKIGLWLKDMDSAQSRSFVLESGISGPLENVIGADGASMLQPLNGDYSLIKKIAAESLLIPLSNSFNAASSTEIKSPAENAQIIVLNGTYVTGLAAKVADELKAKGFFITRVGNAPVRGYERNYIYDTSSGQHKKTLQSLEKELNAITALETPEWLASELSSPDANLLDDSTDIVVVLGEKG